MPYAPNVLNERWAIRQPYYEYVWLRFFENDDVVDEYSPFLTRKSNIRVTGLPMYDCFLNYNIENRANVWKPQDKLKKKIKTRVIIEPTQTLIKNVLPLLFLNKKQYL